MSDVTITSHRAGWLVGTDDDTGATVAVHPDDLTMDQPTAYPVAPVVEVDAWHLVVLCPTCRPKRAGGKPIRHTHGRGNTARLAEGHRVAHCDSPDYVVLLLDADAVLIKDPRLERAGS